MHDDRPSIDFAVFGTSPLDSKSPIPLYHQIEGHLRQLIVSGQLPANTVLPPELELGTWYGVGRHTMRTALTNLVNDRLISRRAGVGTYVLAQTQHNNFYLNRSFTHQITAMGNAPTLTRIVGSSRPHRCECASHPAPLLWGDGPLFGAPTLR